MSLGNLVTQLSMQPCLGEDVFSVVMHTFKQHSREKTEQVICQGEEVGRRGTTSSFLRKLEIYIYFFNYTLLPIYIIIQ